MCDELGVASIEAPPDEKPFHSAIDAGWVAAADEPDYTNSTVSQVMDDVRAFIARASNRDEDQIEKADTALAAVAVSMFRSGHDFVCIVTTDIDAGEGVVAALEANGFTNRVQVKNGFNLLDEIT